MGSNVISNRIFCLAFSLLFIHVAFAQDSLRDVRANLPVQFLEISLAGTKRTFSETAISAVLNRRGTDGSLRKSKNSDESFYPNSNLRKLFLNAAGKIAASHGLFLLFLFSSTTEYTSWDYRFGKELFAHAGERLHFAYSHPPILDNDPFEVNYLQHPYAGSFYYNTIRSKGASALASFGMSWFGSTLFEYFAEAMFETPSLNDLIATPVLGSLLGESIHQITLGMARNGFTKFEKAVVFLINPAYVWNHGFKAPSENRRMQLKKLRKINF